MSTKNKKLLIQAVEKGTLAKVKELLDLTPDLHKDGEKFGYLLLVSALKRKHRSMSRLLMKNHCKVKIASQTKSHCTPLYYAVEMNDINIFRELYRNGASVHDTDTNELSALELAIAHDETKFIEHILDNVKLPQSSKDLKPGCNQDVALFHAACWADDLPAVELFMSLGFSVRSCTISRSRDFNGLTPLHFALYGRAIKVIPYLLKHDVDFHAQDVNGDTPLHLAFKLGIESDDFTEDIVKEYSHRSNRDDLKNSVDHIGLTHFHTVCSIRFKDKCDLENQLSLLEHFINNGLDINYAVQGPVLPDDQQFSGFTALHFAAYRSCYDVSKLLLQNGADPNKTNSAGHTPLHVLADEFSSCFENERDLRIAELLLEYGANIDAQDSENSTPLHYAYYRQRRNQTLIQFFLSKIQSKLNLTNHHELSYFFIACTGVDLGLVERYLKNGASVKNCIETDIGDCKGYSAIHFAIEFNRAEIVEYLLNNGADANNISRNCETSPLHLACSNELSHFWESDVNHENTEADWLPNRDDQIRIIELLLKHGAHVNAKNSREKTPLFEVCKLPVSVSSQFTSWKREDYKKCLMDEIATRQKKIIDILVLHGADLDVRNRKGKSILHKVSERYEYKCQTSGKNLIEALLKKGANVHIVEDAGLTPLHYVVQNYLDPTLMDLYLNYGADINTTSCTNCTPLHTAVEQWHSYYSNTLTIFDKLLEHPDVDLNAQNDSGDTPLHRAVSLGKKLCVQKLLDAGADINVENRSGAPPMAYMCTGQSINESVYPHDKDTNLKECINILVTHVKKLLKLNLFVSEKARIFIAILISSHCELQNSAVDAMIDAEVNLLKSCKIDRYTSLYDILLKNSNDMVKHVKNPSLQKMVSTSQLYNDFPLCHAFLAMQYKRGLIRASVMGRAKEALRVITNANWSDSCAEQILRYLNNKNLNLLIKSALTDKSSETIVSDPSVLGVCGVKFSKYKKVILTRPDHDFVNSHL